MIFLTAASLNSRLNVRRWSINRFSCQRSLTYADPLSTFRGEFQYADDRRDGLRCPNASERGWDGLQSRRGCGGQGLPQRGLSSTFTVRFIVANLHSRTETQVTSQVEEQAGGERVGLSSQPSQYTWQTRSSATTRPQRAG